MTQSEDLINASTLVQFLNKDDIRIINIGLEKFASTYQEMGLNVIQVDWKPPIKIDDDLSNMLSMLK
jgi:hypothetical protein